MVLFIWEVLKIPRIIVKTGYIKGKAHKEYYVQYIATREGVEKYKSDHGDKPATNRQKQLISQLMKDYPETREMFEYDDYTANPTRENASELISSVIDSNIHDIATKENYVDYISHRPRVEKLGEHGLFSDHGYEVHLKDVIDEVGKHEGNVWTHIISLKREDALRLGYDYVQNWMSLCQGKRNELAEAMKIDVNHLKWYAAFHNEGHHPHIHMIVYSTDVKEGFVTKQGIEKIRGMFAKEIFKQDLIQTYSEQTEIRNELKKYSHDIVEKMLQGIEVSHIDNDYIFRKIMELKTSLENYHGRLAFAYIPKQSKQIINDILREMEKNEYLQQLYEQWLIYKQDIHSTYNDGLLERLPLLEQKEFRSIKNMILKEVMSFQTNEIFDFQEIQETEDDSQLFNDNDIEDVEDTNNKGSTANGFILEWTSDYKSAVEYFYGNGNQEQDIKKAEELLKMERQRNNVLAYALLGKLYAVNQKEELSNQFYEKSFKGFEELLNEAGENKFVKSYCSYRVGKQYLYGMGTEIDYQKAYEYFEQSDNPYAQYSLGVMYKRGLGVIQSDATALEWFALSADGGNAYGNYEVARHYDYGIGREKNDTLAESHYQKTYHSFCEMIEKQEDDNLLYRLGMMTLKGKGCEKDIDKAISYLEKAVSLENENAKLLLAQIYLQEDVYENIPRAMKWLEESENQLAYYILGKEYFKGEHIEKDLEKAIHYLSQCDDNEYAYYILSKIYEEMENDHLSIYYLKQACHKEYEPALVKMTKLLVEGQKAEKDVDKAIDYLKIADSNNNQFAQYMLGKLFLFGKDVEQDKELSVEYLTKSAEQGNEYAQYLLEHMDDFYNHSLAMMTSRFFHHVSRIFQNQLPTNNHPLAGTERKLKQKLMQKKLAMGHKQDDHTLN